MEVVNDGGSVDCRVQLGFNNFEFKFPHILWEIIIIVDTGIGEPGGGFSSRVGTLESGLEVFDEV